MVSKTCHPDLKSDGSPEDPVVKIENKLRGGKKPVLTKAKKTRRKNRREDKNAKPAILHDKSKEARVLEMILEGNSRKDIASYFGSSDARMPGRVIDKALQEITEYGQQLADRVRTISVLRIERLMNIGFSQLERSIENDQNIDSGFDHRMFEAMQKLIKLEADIIGTAAPASPPIAFQNNIVVNPTLTASSPLYKSVAEQSIVQIKEEQPQLPIEIPELAELDGILD